MERELEKLEVNLGGVSTMARLPEAVLVIDPKREAIATKEVNKLGLPLIGLCDTNCDPDEVQYLIPGNDDAIRSCTLIVKTLARAAEEGRAKIPVAEFNASETGPEGGSGEAGVDEGIEGPADGMKPESKGPKVARAGRPEAAKGIREGVPARRVPVRRAAKAADSVEAPVDADDVGASGGEPEHSPESAVGQEKTSDEKGPGA